MSCETLQTVTGAIRPDDLGRTLMHEHLLVAYPGSEADTVNPGPDAAERFARCIDRIEELKSLGFSSMLDPCPSDLGRDVELMAKVAQATDFQIICATGLYKQSEGSYPYWHMRGNFGSTVGAMTEIFIRDIVDGIGETGVRAGIIKVATGPNEMTEYERGVFEAAAQASVETGVPITTHTDQGSVGDLQQRVLTENGVLAHRIVIGHSCGTSDHGYHMGIAREGSYLGFDRFGLGLLHPDEERVASLAKSQQTLTTGQAKALILPSEPLVTRFVDRTYLKGKSEAFDLIEIVWDEGAATANAAATDAERAKGDRKSVG